MKLFDINLHSPEFIHDPEATRQIAAYTAKLQDILRFIVDNLQAVEIVTSAPVATEMDEIGDEAGKVKSDIKILHNATQTNRKIYYKYQGTVYLIDSA